MTQNIPDVVTTKEKQKWESWLQNSTDFFRSSLAEDFIAIDSSGLVIKKPEMVAYVVDQEVKDYSISDIQVVTLSDDVTLVTYRATQRYIYKGQENSNNVVVSSVWVNRGGEWVNILHQETPVQQ